MVHQPRHPRFSPEVRQAIERQLVAFREKFGRDPNDDDPILFDPDVDHPAPLCDEKYERMMIEAMTEVGISQAPMSKPHRNTRSLRLDDPLFAVKQCKAVPHEFVLEAIAALSPGTRPMFGCLAVYVEDKIVLILRGKRDKTADNGVWLATTEEHHQSLRREFPNMRSIREESHGLAGPARRCAGFRGGGAARMRAHCREGSSNRQGAGGTAGLEIGGKECGEIVEACSQERRE